MGAVRNEDRASLPASDPARAPRLGLRLQLVLSLGVLALIAFVPLFLAVASLTRHVLRQNREEVARSLGRAVAGRLAADAAAARTDEAIHDVAIASLESSTDTDAADGVVAIRVVREGQAPIEVGGAATIDALQRLGTASIAERTVRTSVEGGPILDVEAPTNGGVVQVALRVGDQASRAAPLLRLVAFYTASFAIALIVFAYLLLTRLIVRPIATLAAATRRIEGGRRLEAVRSGAAEVVELSRAIARATSRLVDREEALAAKVDELQRAEQALAAKVRQLEAARADLLAARDTIVRTERLASVGRLVAGLAHEVGNPIAALMGLQDVLLTGDLDDETRDLVARMKRETERVHRVLRDLLDFARAEQPSPVQPTQGAADVRDVVEEVIALVAPQRTLRDVSIAADVVAPLARVRLAASRLQQVLLNVVMNAADAIVGAGRSQGKIAVVARAVDGRPFVRVTVSDDGPGVDEAVRAALFEPFVTTKDVGKGTGLGLAVCRGLVEGAGGTIDLAPPGQSPLGGASFVIELPTIDAPPPARSVAPPPVRATTSDDAPRVSSAPK